MRVLVINRGSSTIKCDLFDGDRVFKARLQWKNRFEEPALSINGQSEEVSEPTPEDVLKSILGGLDSVDIVGHRIVHGGGYFKKSVLIDGSVKEKIRSLSDLAPLHNPSELEAVEIAERIFPSARQVAVFDTAFHHTIPETAALYPGPYEWFEEGIRRFGFHGISCQYCVRRVEELLDDQPEKMIVCHLGSGASLTAVKNGKSIDTTMGFTPLEGLMMDTRSGSVDPGLLLHLLKEKTPQELSDILFHQSGLLGVSGSTSDMKEIIESLDKPRSKLAFELYLHRLNGLIGGLTASLQGLDALIFTAGIGENAALLREKVGQTFAYLGMQIDPALNLQTGDRFISTPASKVKVLVIRTQEASEIARICLKKV